MSQTNQRTTQRINLQLAAHNVALDVQRELEPYYRKATSLLNRRYQFYAQHMPKASAEQLWLYVALEMAVNLHSDKADKDLVPIEKKINELNQLLLHNLPHQQ